MPAHPKHHFLSLADAAGAMDALDEIVSTAGIIQDAVDEFADLPSPVGLKDGIIYVVRLDTPGYDNGFYVIEGQTWQHFDALNFQDSDEVPNKSGVTGASVTDALDALLAAGGVSWPFVTAGDVQMRVDDHLYVGYSAGNYGLDIYGDTNRIGYIKDTNGLKLIETSGTLGEHYFGDPSNADTYILSGGRVFIGGASLYLMGNALRNCDHVELQEITTPSATSNYGKIYTKVDNKFYFQDGSGAEHPVAVTTGFVMKGDGHIALDATTGSMLATAADQKLGHWGATPVIQPSHIADASTEHTLSSFADVEAALDTIGTTINNILANVLEVPGHMASA